MHPLVSTVSCRQDDKRCAVVRSVDLRHYNATLIQVGNTSSNGMGSCFFCYVYRVVVLEANPVTFPH